MSSKADVWRLRKDSNSAYRPGRDATSVRSFSDCKETIHSYNYISIYRLKRWMLSALQVEELKADLADVKEMYREQIDMLVNQVVIVIII